MESILKSVKKMLGLDAGYDAFDVDIIIHINSVLDILYQMGVGEKAFHIESDDETWSDFIPIDDDSLNLIKSYVYLKVRMQFDPPTGGVAESLNNMIKEYEWRINIAVDSGEEETDE